MSIKGFNLDAAKLLPLINTAQSTVAQFSSDDTAFAIKCGEKGSYLQVMAGAAIVVLSLETIVTSVHGKFSFCFDPDILQHVLKKRANLEVEFKNNQLKILSKTKTGAYTGEVNTSKYDEARFSSCIINKPRNGLTMSKDLVSAIMHGIKSTGIKAVHAQEEINTLLRIKDEVAYVAATDSWHNAMFKSKKIKGAQPFDLALPSSYFNSFARVNDHDIYEDASPTLSLNGSNSVTFSSSKYSVTLPAIQIDKDMFEQVFSLFDNLGQPVANFDMEHDHLLAAIENLSGIYQQGSIVKLDEPIVKGDKCAIRLSTESSYGKLRDTMVVQNLKFSKKFKGASIDPMTFLDSVSLLSGVISVGILHEKPAAIKFDKRLDNGTVVHLGMLV